MTPLADLPRMWANEVPGTTSVNGTLHDVWLEGDRHSRLGGERTLVLKEVPVLVATSVVEAWNGKLADLERLAASEAWIEAHDA